MTAHSHSEVQYFRTCPEESPSSWSTNVAQNVIPEIHKNVILEIFYRGSKYFVIPNLIGDPVFIFLFLPIRTENSLFFLFICLKKKYFLDSRFRGNDREVAGMTRKIEGIRLRGSFITQEDAPQSDSGWLGFLWSLKRCSSE